MGTPLPCFNGNSFKLLSHRMVYFASFMFVCIAILGNLNSIAIKRILKDNGFDVKYFSSHYKDTINILKLAKVTTDNKTRKRYHTLGFLDIAYGLLFIGSSIFLFSSFIFK